MRGEGAAIVESFRANGWARLGTVADEATLAALRARADDIAAGRVAHEPFFFQHDTDSGRYEDLAFRRGWTGPSDNYRKIEKLERDDLFRAFLASAPFERVVRALLGDGEVVLYRALLMCKRARGGTVLPWHQDGGSFWGLDRDPEVQIWTALDDAPADAGCVEVLPRSHLDGLATPLGGVVPAEIVRARDADANRLTIPARAGEALLIHNYVWHRSGVNTTERPRRALSVCYMSGDVKCRRTRRAPRTFPRVFAMRSA